MAYAAAADEESSGNPSAGGVSLKAIENYRRESEGDGEGSFDRSKAGTAGGNKGHIDTAQGRP